MATIMSSTEAEFLGFPRLLIRWPKPVPSHTAQPSILTRPRATAGHTIGSTSEVCHCIIERTFANEVLSRDRPKGTVSFFCFGNDIVFCRRARSKMVLCIHCMDEVGVRFPSGPQSRILEYEPKQAVCFACVGNRKVQCYLLLRQTASSGREFRVLWGEEACDRKRARGSS